MGPKFVAWDMPLPELMTRLANNWPAETIMTLGEDPCWFDLKDAGLEHFAELRKRFAAELECQPGF